MNSVGHETPSFILEDNNQNIQTQAALHDQGGHYGPQVPSHAAIVDYKAQADASGHLVCEVELARGRLREGSRLSCRILSDRQHAPRGSILS